MHEAAPSDRLGGDVVLPKASRHGFGHAWAVEIDAGCTLCVSCTLPFPGIDRPCGLSAEIPCRRRRPGLAHPSRPFRWAGAAHATTSLPPAPAGWYYTTSSSESQPHLGGTDTPAYRHHTLNDPVCDCAGFHHRHGHWCSRPEHCRFTTQPEPSLP